jgi:hypothetical protein
MVELTLNCVDILSGVKYQSSRLIHGELGFRLYRLFTQ